MIEGLVGAVVRLISSRFEKFEREGWKGYERTTGESLDVWAILGDSIAHNKNSRHSLRT